MFEFGLILILKQTRLLHALLENEMEIKTATKNSQGEFQMI